MILSLFESSVILFSFINDTDETVTFLLFLPNDTLQIDFTLSLMDAQLFTQIALPQRFIIDQTQVNQLWERKEGQFGNHFEEVGGEFAVLGPASEHEVAEVRIGENREGFSGVLLAGNQGAFAAEQRLDDSAAVRDGVEHRPPRTAVREVAEVPLSEQRLGDFAPLSELKPLQNLVEGRFGHTDFRELFDGHFAVLVDVFEDFINKIIPIQKFLSDRVNVNPSFAICAAYILTIHYEFHCVKGQKCSLLAFSECKYFSFTFFFCEGERNLTEISILKAQSFEYFVGPQINHNYNISKAFSNYGL